MRYALPASALVHAGIFGIALVGFVWPKPDDAPPPGAVTVDIISVTSVSSNETSTVEDGSSENLTSAGSEIAAVTPSETLEPVEPETQISEVPVEQAVPPEPVEQTPPVEVAEAEPVEAEPVEPVTETMEVAVLSTPVASPTPTDTVAPMAVETVEPEEVTDFNAAPVPHTLTFERPSAPTQRPRPQQPAPQQQATRTVTKPATQAGNGGQSNADSAAAPATAGQQGQGGGGASQLASWQNQVQRRLNNAKRYPRSAGRATGTAMVSFTITAGGALAGVSLSRSSGNPALDQAAIDAVNRAAPFPPVPTGTSKSMAVPVDFTR
jgi:protein TonB